MPFPPMCDSPDVIPICRRVRPAHGGQTYRVVCPDGYLAVGPTIGVALERALRHEALVKTARAALDLPGSTNPTHVPETIPCW